MTSPHVTGNRVLINRLFVPLLLGIIILIATLAAWKALSIHEVEQISRIAEAESYATRSRLVRNIDSMLRAFRDVQTYWSIYGHLPRDQWSSDAGIELAHFAGVEAIIWNDSGRSIRYARTTEHPVLDYRPTDEEWAVYEKLLAKTGSISGEGMLGPFVDENGQASYEIYVVASDPGEGTLVAVVDADEACAHLLADDSPGYAISIQWKDTLLYQRGKPGADLPPEWSREGVIQNSMGAAWTVTHTPTEDFARTLQTPAVSAVLVAGVAIAFLVGLLVFENARANRRATAAVRAESELFQLNRDLESQIAQRTQELKERSADLVTIADSVAHDMRNPLNSISLNAQVLEQQFSTKLGQDGQSILRQMSRGIQGMNEILERLLRLSIVSNSVFTRQRLNMRDLVARIFEELGAAEPPPPVQLQLENLPDANADPNLVPTLLLNLLGNALKYSRGKADRSVEVGSEFVDQCTTYFVKDNGIGFDAESTGRLFKPFERLNNNLEKDGLGLGLDISARIVYRHGGRIWAEGKPGDGATFYFTLGAESAVD
jgi:signal transduction histidine kinase